MCRRRNRDRLLALYDVAYAQPQGSFVRGSIILAAVLSTKTEDRVEISVRVPAGETFFQMRVEHAAVFRAQYAIEKVAE